MEHEKIFIITVNWNRYEETSSCLDSLRKVHYPNTSIIVVDNGSTDGSLDLIIARYPEVVVLKHDCNLGFAAANNFGLQYALTHQADFCLLLNNDTVVDPEILKGFLEVAWKRPDAGIFGAKIYYYSDPQRIWWARPVWDDRRVAFNNVGSNEIDNGKDHSNIVEIGYANGCALFVRMSVVRKIGLMDERFFNYFEDVDWCTRAKQAGYKILFVPAAKLWHKIGRSSGGQGSPLESYFLIRNELLWAYKNGLTRNIYFFLRKTFKFLQLYLTSGSCKKKGQVHTGAMIRGMIDYALGRFGDCPQIIRGTQQ